MNEKAESLERSKKSVIKLADILAQAGIALVAGPELGLAYGLVYGISKILGGHAQNFIKNRNNERLNYFYETLLKGDLGEDEIEEFLQKDIDIEEYYTLLRAAIQDDEDKKTYYYAELLRKLALGKVLEEYKPYLMRVVRELNSFEVELLRRIYIHENYDLIPKEGPSEQMSALLLRKDLATKLAIDGFNRLGLVEKDGQNSKPTSIAFYTAETLFKKNDLTPDSIGSKVWRKINSLIVTPQESRYITLSTRIQQLLRDNQLRPSPILLFGPKLLERVSLANIALIILVIGKTNHEGFSSLKEMDELARTVDIPSSVKVIKVLVKADNLPCDDFLPSIQADEIINCSLDEVIELQALDESIKNFVNCQ